DLRSVMGDASVRVGLIEISTGAKVDSIKVFWLRQSQTIDESDRHGGGGGSLSRLSLNPGEKIIQVKGTLGEDDDREVVSNLQFVTNHRQPPPFGPAEMAGERQFEFNAPQNGEIIGFFGNSGRLLDALGVIIRTLP